MWLLRKNNSNTSDEYLLMRYRENGKVEELSVLYERYMPMIYGVALKYLKNADDARDAVMEMFEELLEKVLKYEIVQFRTWLYSYVRNFCLQELRRRSKNVPVELTENFMESCDDFNLDHIREQEDRERVLMQCVEALPEKQRISVCRFFFEERSYKEIEEATGFSMKLVKSFIQNGKRNLKLCLEKKGIKN